MSSNRLFNCASPAEEPDWVRRPADGRWGVVDPSSEEAGFGQNLWNFEVPTKKFVDLPLSGATTMVEALETSAERFSRSSCVGTRAVHQVHMVPDSSGKEWEKLELANTFDFITYKAYYERVLQLTAAFQSVCGVKPLSKVVIYAETQRDWMMCAFAAWHCNATVVTIYATLGPEGAVHGINETEAGTVVCDAKLLKVLQKLLPQCPHIQHIVSITAIDAATKRGVSDGQDGRPSVHDLDEMLASGGAYDSTAKPTRDDIAVIMYTSGTTGAPKGVVISHRNILATMAGVEHALKGAVGPGDVYLAYLPLAHIMEMVAECSFMGLGAALGFGSPSTLLNTGDAAKKLFGEEVKLKNPTVKPKVAHSLGDAPLLRPTFMIFPPAVLDKIYQGVTTKMKDAHMGWLLDMGLKRGEEARTRNTVGAGLLSGKLFQSKVQTMVGGRVKGIISGSAPLSPEVQTFVQTVFKCPVRQGYGLTETCAASCVAFWGDYSIRSVGPPTVNSTIRLADWQDGNYLNSDAKNPAIGMPRGEVLIGGPGVSVGYFINPKNPNEDLEKKNAEDWITIGGIRYFRTGDIGQITAQGLVQIIDRKKDLWKGPNGEYVALAKVEQALTLCPFVALPMVYGRTGGDFPVALICPQRLKIMDLGKELGVQGDFAALCKDKKVVERVLKACTDVCKEKKLVAFEIPKKIALSSDLWTPENELLTAAMKLKRPAIAAHHKAELDALYA